MVLPGHLEGRLVRLGAAVHQPGGVEIARGHLGQETGQFDGPGIRRVHGRVEGQGLGLTAHRLQHPGVPVSDVRDVHPRQPVQVLLSADIPEADPLGLGHDEGSFTNSVICM